jgi:cobaltochelatase CobS
MENCNGVMGSMFSNNKDIFSEREQKDFDVTEVFGLKTEKLDDKTGKPKKFFVKGYTKKTDLVPDIDPDYVFPLEETKMALYALKSKDRTLLVGETGTGKTSLVEQIAARLNYNVVKISFDGCITRQDLLGEKTVVPNPNGSGSVMQYQYGILVTAMQIPGTIIILDEWDTISSECSFVIQRVLQKEDGKLLLLENGGEMIHLHPDNVIMATANTNGQGDETGNYGQGTKVQNYAQINRFGTTIRLHYLSEENEIKVMTNKFGNKLKKEDIVAFVKTVNSVREGYINGNISVPLSTRDLVNWLTKHISLADIALAAKYAFLNRMSSTDRLTTEGLMQRILNIQQKA